MRIPRLLPLLLLPTVLAFAGCGNKGNLFLPPAEGAAVEGAAGDAPAAAPTETAEDNVPPAESLETDTNAPLPPASPAAPVAPPTPVPADDTGDGDDDGA